METQRQFMNEPGSIITSCWMMNEPGSIVTTETR